MDQYIYKIATLAQWLDAEAQGEFKGAPIDLSDGFIHFSTSSQTRKTAALHFEGQLGLKLLKVDAKLLGEPLIYEPSRGGDLFPHLYGVLPLSAITDIVDIEVDETGTHIFPDEIE